MTSNKEIVPAIPRENIPEKKVEKVIPEKVIAPQQATPKEVIPEKTAEKVIFEKKEATERPAVDGEKEIAVKKPTFKIIPKETISKEVISTKTTGETTPKKTTGADITVSGGWSNFERIPASEEAPLPTKTTPEKKKFSLNPEEEKLIVKEIKKLTPPASYEEEKLSDFIKLLERSGNLPKHEDLLRTLVEKELNRWPHLSNSTREAIGYLAKIGSAKSIPTLMWAYVKVEYSSDRKVIEKAIKTIKKREGID